MAQSYYYLVSGLPDIVLDAGKTSVGVSDFLNEIREQLDERDASLLDVLRYEYDNRNLIAALEKNGWEFDPRGAFSQDEMEEELKGPEMLPEYMQTVMEAHKNGKPLLPDVSWENQLTREFYLWVSGHPNEFLREWYSFELNIRNILAALNARNNAEQSAQEGSPFAVNRAVVVANDAAEQIIRSNAPDFGLGADLRWIEKVTALNRSNLVEFDKAIDTLRWDMLNDLTTFSYFQVETILAFVLKLTMVQRWQELQPETGRAMFDTLVEELTGAVEVADV